MRSICFVIAVLLACACSKVDNGQAANPNGGCISSGTWTTADRTNDLGINDTQTDQGAGGLKLAQSFLVPGTAGSTMSVTSVSLPLYINTGALTGGTTTLTLRLDSTTTPGTPGSIVSATTVQLASTLINTNNPNLLTFSFDNAIPLATGTTVWIVLDASYGQQASPIVKWAADDGNSNASAYSSGQAQFESNTHVFSTGIHIGSLRELGFVIDCAS